MSILRAITMPVAVLAGVAIAGTPANPAHAATWSVVATPNASTGQNLFIGVDALSTSTVWAVGRADHAPQQPFVRPLAARWNGGWAAESATVPGVMIDAVATGTSTVWTVGYRYDPNLSQLRTSAMRTTNG